MILDKNIVLIGLMGSGKTTFSRLLGKALAIDVVDMDEWIENYWQETIPEMFAQGEEVFRRREHECVEELALNFHGIISTGGGVILNEENMTLLKKESLVIFIDRPVENILQDIQVKDRPLLKKDPQRLYTLSQERYPLYLKYSDVQIKNDSSIEAMLEKLVNVIEKMSL